MIYYEPGNNNIIQLPYCILSMARSLREFDNHCNILKKGFTAPGIMQLMGAIVIIHSLSLFNLIKAISAAFYVGFCGLDVRC